MEGQGPDKVHLIKVKTIFGGYKESLIEVEPR